MWILDTDIGTDCDDAGALRCLLRYAASRGEDVAGIVINTSSPYSPGAVDAILRCEGKSCPIGVTDRKGFFEDEERYIKPLALDNSPSFANGTLKTEDACGLYERLFESAPDGSVTLIMIGFFNTARDILMKRPRLFGAKVKRVVAMAGCFNDPGYAEWNIKNDVEAARTFLDHCTCPVFFSPVELGNLFTTGFEEANDRDPVAKAYRLLCGDSLQRNSWDPVTVDFCFYPDDYTVGPPERITIRDDGTLAHEPDETQKRYCIRFRDDGSMIKARKRINDALIRRIP